MTCQKCKSERVMSAGAKCSDMFWGRLGDKEYDGYVPDGLGIGGGDYVEFKFCLDCGQIQGEFPVPECELEVVEDEDE